MTQECFFKVKLGSARRVRSPLLGLHCATFSGARNGCVPPAMEEHAEYGCMNGSTRPWFRGLFPLLPGCPFLCPPRSLRVGLHPEGDTITGNIYPECFCKDTKQPLSCGFGWSFVAPDDSGNATAFACGRPPRWARSWGLTQGAVHAMPAVPYRRDCLSVGDQAIGGPPPNATSASKYARDWSIFHGANDGDTTDGVDIGWIPAHTQPADVPHLILPKTSLGTTSRTSMARSPLRAKAQAPMPAAP